MDRYTFQNQLKQLETQEAKRKMGTYGAGGNAYGLTNQAGYTMGAGTAPSLNDSTSVGQGEMQNVRNKVNQSGAASGLTNQAGYTMGAGMTPSLSDSTSVGQAEIQKTKQKMNQTGMY